MRAPSRFILAPALLALLAALPGCGGGSTASSTSGTVTIYSSQPLQGGLRTLGEQLANAEELALEQAGHRAGDFNVVLRTLDDSSAETGNWDPGQTAANAREVANDPTAIAYLGDMNSGANAISIPILNVGGVPQVSGTATAVGLTSDGPGADVGEPGKYYPTGQRTFIRVVPSDSVQGRALVALMRDQSCKRAFVLSDQEVYGAGLARDVVHYAPAAGLTILGVSGVDATARTYARLSAQLAARHVDCALYAGTSSSNAVQLFKDLSNAMPNAQLFGPDADENSSFYDFREGGIPPQVASHTMVSAPTMPISNYPEAGQQFFRDYQKRFGETPDAYALYAYESMRLVLDAIKAAGPQGANRAAVLRELFATRDRDSALGTYSIDGNGDTTLTDYGVYRIVNGHLVFDHRITA
jgi:branched-chain amino acid transport system substrate-binding protein